MGIVGIPFRKNGEKSVYDPSIIIGSSVDELAYEYFVEKKEWVKLERPGKKETRRIVTSPHRES